VTARSAHGDEWLSYDSVVETYEEVAVPWFAPMARDLVVAMGISPGARVLDVGTGTGLTAEQVRDALGAGGAVVGVDPSMGMLRLARARRGVAVARAMAPHLPFADASFDAVIANLVVSHLPDLDVGLGDMARVLRPGGRLGATAWGPEPNDTDDQSAEADAMVADARTACGLPSQAPAQAVPWEERLRSRTQLCDALHRAGLVEVHAELHLYRRNFALDHYLSGWGALGRYLRWESGVQRWGDFHQRAAAALRERFGDSVLSVKQAWVATGAAR
jgi:SAM-dependent methyltransferase